MKKGPLRSTIRTLIPQSRREWFLTLPFALLLVVIAVSLLLDRSPVARSRVTLLTPQVKVGEEFKLEYDVVWRSSCRVEGRRFIVDSGRKAHSFMPDSRRVHDGPDRFEITLQVPKDAALGPAEYQGTIQFRCNWLQDLLPIEQTLSVREFEIIP